MNRRALLPAGLALLGVLLVAHGITQELLTARFAGGPEVTTGWGRDPNHEETLLVALALCTVPVAAAAARFPRAGYLVQAVGGVVAFYALRATVYWALQPSVYTGLPYLPGGNGDLVLGMEPFTLLGGALLLVAAGVLAAHPGWLRTGVRERAPAPS